MKNSEVNFEKSCGAIIFRKENGVLKFLLVKEKSGGHWGFPKGHIDEGETEQEAAGREIYEETGLRVKFLDGFRSTVQYSPKENTVKDVVFFLANSPNKSVNCGTAEIEDYDWLGLAEALESLTFDNSKVLLMAACDFLSKDT
ncbi:NUDIX domain-containing protein [Acidobacteria bacterium AH-259-D05]|nr:NUDIX domain-containing protein [Acidobacteria bacterium AH-259-D05]